MKSDEIKDVLALYLLCQSVVHKVDELSDKAVFKQEFKKRSNLYCNFVEKHLNTLTKDMDFSESDYYISIVKEIDKLVNGIKVEGL
jgi:hypothetical protein